MYSKKISLITPLRGQRTQFSNLIQSLIKNTNCPKDIEILLMVDNDDQDTPLWLEYYGKLANEHGFTVLKFMTERSDHFTKDYINPLARYSEGRFIMNINADSEFKTPKWDLLIYSAMDRASWGVKDDVWLGLIKDNLRRTGEDPLYPNFACFPLVSKQAVDYLGYFLDERFKVWGPDHFIADVYKHIGRLVSLTHVEVDHISIHTGKREDDGNFARFQRIHDENPVKMSHKDLDQECSKLLTLIQKLKEKK